MQSFPNWNLLVLPFVLGCGLNTGPIEGLHLSAGAVAPGLTESLAIRFEIANRGSRVLHVAACDGLPLVDVEREEVGTWVNISAGFCQTHLNMVPLQLPADEQLSGSRPVDRPGRYRVIAYGTTPAGVQAVVVISNVVAAE
jgi:hypothetical protein